MTHWMDKKTVKLHGAYKNFSVFLFHLYENKNYGGTELKMLKKHAKHVNKEIIFLSIFKADPKPFLLNHYYPIQQKNTGNKVLTEVLYNLVNNSWPKHSLSNSQRVSTGGHKSLRNMCIKVVMKLCQWCYYYYIA